MIEVRRGDYTIAAYRKDDLGLRNLAIISLTESGVSGSTAAALFSLTPVQISRIRDQYRQHGSAGLTPGQVRQARSWAGAGVTHGEIARRLAVSRPLITALIGSHGPLYLQDELPGTGRRGSPSRRPPGRPRRSPATALLPPPCGLSRRTSPPERVDEPLFSPPGPEETSSPAGGATGRASQIASFTSVTCPTRSRNRSYPATSRRTFSSSGPGLRCRARVLPPSDRVRLYCGP